MIPRKPRTRILILEDDPERHRAFRKRLEDPVIVTTAAECIRLLETEEWSDLYLDHDLGGQVYVESGPGTGYEVACWLEEHPERKPSRIVLHSLNPAGRAKMKAALPDAYDRPGIWLPMEVRERLFAIDGGTS
jgi:CheY-like chemotaxis protein